MKQGVDTKLIVPVVVWVGIIISMLAFVSCCAADPKFLHAIHMVETGGRKGAVLGDNGRALGPFQIHFAYWLDSRVPGKYEECQSYEYGAKVVIAYLNRYAPDAVRKKDYHTLARLHNAGPKALENKTLARNYAAKVMRFLIDKKRIP